MKKVLLLLILITVIASLFVGCGAKNQGELIFELNESGTEYTVSFTGRKNCSDIIIPEEHDGLPVTGIADFAFKNHRKLKNITIPASITHIGEKAFAGCTRLKNVYLSDIKAWCEITFDYTFVSFKSNPFAYADNLYLNGEPVTDLVIPEDVTMINDATFYKCPSLNSVTIPQGVIGESAFYNCKNLKEIYIGKGVTVMEISAFENCTGLEKVYFNAVNMSDPIGLQDSQGVPLYNYIFANAGEKSGGVKVVIGKDATRVPSRLFSSTDAAGVISVEFEEGSVCTTIAAYAFQNCPDLKSVHVPPSVTTIGNEAFSGCKSLSEVTLSEGLTTLDRYAFYNCSSIKEIHIPSTITQLYPSTFNGCTGLTKMNIPAGVTTINADMLEGCVNVKEINVDENNTAFKSIDGNVYSKDGKTFVKFAPGKEDTDFTIPDSVIIIGNYAFSKCKNLVSITVPDSVTAIGDYAFRGCSSLKSVTIGNSVTKIDNYAFSECIRLTSINIPSNVTKIGNYAFQNCRKLKKITIPGSVTEIGTRAFFGCENITIRCETASKPDGWNLEWNPLERKVVWGYTES